MSTRRTNLNLPKPKLGGNRERRSPRRTKTPSSNELKNKYKFSPKGKRKLDFPFKGSKPGPLSGKLFYLDLNGSRYATQLKKTIQQLGGTIEEFFRKEVTYLVTSRGDCGKSPSSQSAPSPGTPSPIPLTRSSSLKNYAAASPMSTDSPQGFDAHIQVPKGTGTMRGKSIAQRSAGFKKGTIDILTNATTWGVNILHVDHVMKWCSQLMLKSKQQQQGSSKQKTTLPSKRVSQTKLPKVAALKETYIKVEDLGFKYRPLVHEFKVWPEITFDCSNVCPFDPPRRRSSENSSSKKKGGEGNVKRPPVHERPRHGYCECCEVRYSDLETHLRGKQHKEYARKGSNYISLDKAIDVGPNFEDLKKIQFKKSSSSDTTHVLEKRSVSVSCESTDDVENDEVFLVSTPRSSGRIKREILDHTPPSKENRNNGKEGEKVTFSEDGMDNGYNNVEDIESVPKPRSFKMKTKAIESKSNLASIGAKEIESIKTGSGTRLQKASLNYSPTDESKPTSSRSKCENSGIVIKNKGDNKNIRRIKRKSTESNKSEILQCSNKTSGNVSMVLKDLDNEFIKSTEKGCENKLQQVRENIEIESKTKLRSNRNNKKTCVKSVSSQSDNAASSKKSEQSNLNSNEEFQCSAIIKKDGIKEIVSPKGKSATHLRDINQTSMLEKPVPGDNCSDCFIKSPHAKKNNGNVERNEKSIHDQIGAHESKESDQQDDNEKNHSLRRSKRKCNKTNSNSSDGEEDEQQSEDSPLRLQTLPKNVSNENHFAMCPGALIEVESTLTTRSARRRKSAVGSCKLSPISPCNPGGGEYSVRSSCSEDIEFLPSGLRIYSSFGSSLGDVSKDVKDLVDRIGEQFYDDDGDVSENRKDVKSETDGEILRGRTVESSRSQFSKDVSQKNEQVNNNELQVSVTFMNTDAISFVRGKDLIENIKRKRNHEDEPTKARKCKRLLVNVDSRPDDKSESGVIDTSVSDVMDTYRSSVAERVKLNRALFESLQACSSPNAEPPQIHLTGRKRKTVLLSSPFAEITNTCKKRRERAQSERKVKKGTRSMARKSLNGRTEHPRSACLIPNDPFSFDGY